MEKEEAIEDQTREPGFSQPGRAMQIQKPAEPFTWGEGVRKERDMQMQGKGRGVVGMEGLPASELEKDNVLRVSCRGGEQGTSGRQAGDGFSVGRDEPLSGHMSTIARLCQDGCGAVGGRGAQLQDVLRHQR